MKVVIFGTGMYYRNRRAYIDNKTEIVAFIDSNINKIGRKIDGIMVYSPEKISSLEYDVVILCSIHATAMRRQLILLGVDEAKIQNWWMYYGKTRVGIINILNFNYLSEARGKKLLLISHSIDYSGAPMALLYAAMALRGKGFEVAIAAPKADRAYIDEFGDRRITFLEIPSLPYINEEDMYFFGQFDYIIVNTLLMIYSAYILKNTLRVVLWVHESVRDLFVRSVSEYEELADEEKYIDVNACAVSGVSANMCGEYYPGLIKRIIPYGIPDKNASYISESNSKMVFAVIGNICSFKGQDIFVEAVNIMKTEYRNKARFIVVGKCEDDCFKKKIEALNIRFGSVEFCGELNQAQIDELYSTVDVVVCPSRVDSLPIAITEAMMRSKICVVSDVTGSCDYIDNGINGYIFKTEDSEELSNIMENIINGEGIVDNIRECARKTYEKYFSMEAFAVNLLNILEK